MLGATTTQLCTSILCNGFEYIGKILRDLEEWMSNKGYDSFEQIRGKALSSLKAFEEIKIEPIIAQPEQKCTHSNCQVCINACIYDAIKKDGDKIIIDKKLCSGCGLCINLCHKQNLKLIWNE